MRKKHTQVVGLWGDGWSNSIITNDCQLSTVGFLHPWSYAAIIVFLEVITTLQRLRVPFTSVGIPQQSPATRSKAIKPLGCHPHITLTWLDTHQLNISTFESYHYLAAAYTRHWYTMNSILNDQQLWCSMKHTFGNRNWQPDFIVKGDLQCLINCLMVVDKGLTTLRLNQQSPLQVIPLILFKTG